MNWNESIATIGTALGALRPIHQTARTINKHSPTAHY